MYLEISFLAYPSDRLLEGTNPATHSEFAKLSYQYVVALKRAG